MSETVTTSACFRCNLCRTNPRPRGMSGEFLIERRSIPLVIEQDDGFPPYDEAIIDHAVAFLGSVAELTGGLVPWQEDPIFESERFQDPRTGEEVFWRIELEGFDEEGVDILRSEFEGGQGEPMIQAADKNASPHPLAITEQSQPEESFPFPVEDDEQLRSHKSTFGSTGES